jgi:hypothetical protein
MAVLIGGPLSGTEVRTDQGAWRSEEYSLVATAVGRPASGWVAMHRRYGVVVT